MNEDRWFSRLEPNLLAVLLSLCAWGVLLVAWGIIRAAKYLRRFLKL